MAYRFHIRLLLAILVAALLCAAGVDAAPPGKGADGAVHPDPHAATAAHDEHHTLPLKAVELFHIGKFTVTNSMLMTWIVAALIIFFAQRATRNIKAVPTGAQNFWEWLAQS